MEAIHLFLLSLVSIKKYYWMFFRVNFFRSINIWISFYFWLEIIFIKIFMIISFIFNLWFTIFYIPFLFVFLLFIYAFLFSFIIILFEFFLFISFCLFFSSNGAISSNSSAYLFFNLSLNVWSANKSITVSAKVFSSLFVYFLLYSF
jgi:hypothetical protein